MTRKYAIKIVIEYAQRGTRIEKEVEIYATNLANRTKCMSTNAKKLKTKFVKTCSIYH
jgi:hypothetical protein